MSERKSSWESEALDRINATLREFGKNIFIALCLQIFVLLLIIWVVLLR